MISNIIIIGSNGRIGSALCAYAIQNNMNLHTVLQSDYTSWKNVEDAEQYLRKLNCGENSILLYASGIINPAHDTQAIMKANYSLPVIACEAAKRLHIKSVTFGTVMETIVPPEAQNDYVKSKYMLQQIACENWLHLQLHTIYGGDTPTSFMFLGQILDALNSDGKFSMTAGTQFREYHHVEDEVVAIFELISKLEKGCYDLSHGKAITLKDLAQGIFKHFDKEELLGIGDLKPPKMEAYEPVFKRNNHLQDCKFRDTLPAIINWLEAHIE